MLCRLRSMSIFPMNSGFQKTVEIPVQVVEVGKQRLQFLFQLNVRDAMSEFGMSFRFGHMMPDLVFEIVQVDKLDVELVVEVFNLHQHLAVGLSGREDIQFVAHVVDAVAISGQFFVPLTALLQNPVVLFWGVHSLRLKGEK